MEWSYLPTRSVLGPFHFLQLLINPQYAILLACALNSIAKYCINIIEFRRARLHGGEAAPPWENKSMYLFYIELVTGTSRLFFPALAMSLMHRRFHEAHNLPSILLIDNREAWPPAEHDPRCIHHRSLVCYSIPGTYSVPLGYT